MKRLYKLHTQGYKIQITHTPLERKGDIHNAMDKNIVDLTYFHIASRSGNKSLNEKQFSQAKKSRQPMHHIL